MRQNVGILLPVASLPSEYGIGDFGPNAYRFIDWLSKHHYRYWQVLPLNPLGFGNSPYMSTCSIALDYRYISLEVLEKQGLISGVPHYRENSPYVNYEKVDTFKDKWIYKAFLNYRKGKMEALKKFKTRHPWVMKYATYEAFKKHNNFAPWNYWSDEEIHYYENHNNPPKRYLKEIDYIVFKQYLAHNQWHRLLSYARSKNVKIIDDMPFYVGFDSMECWLNKDLFAFDENNKQTLVGGCPPDAFSEDGQLWGSPIYLFDKMKEDGYQLLVDRTGYLGNMCDYLRIDHFRAFDTYYVIPGDAKNAKIGEWKVGPRDEFFHILKQKYPNIKIIAEDLGDLFPSVIELRDRLNLPGMYIEEFKLFEPNAKAGDNMIVYTGTHDNNTLYGWIKDLKPDELSFLTNKFNCKPHQLYKKIIEHVLSLPSYMTIFPLQDLLKLDGKARMNLPGTCGYPNWAWRLKSFDQLKKAKFKIK